MLSFIGWSSIGNSNWFIFVTLVAYILVAVAYALAHRWGDDAVVLVATLLFAAFVAGLACCKEIHWYNTCLCIPAGMLFYKGRVRMEGYIEKLRIPAWCWGVLMLPVALLAYRYLGRWPYMQNAAAVFFALGVTFIFSCVTLKRLPHFLCWCDASFVEQGVRHLAVESAVISRDGMGCSDILLCECALGPVFPPIFLRIVRCDHPEADFNVD